MSYKLHHDDNFCDEVKMQTNIRFKQSGLSGDEWRVGVSVKFFKKGFLLHESNWRDIETAFIHAWSDFILKGEQGKVDRPDWHKNKCFQAGCSNNATWKAIIKQERCVGGGNCGAKIKHNPLIGKRYRLFCDAHKHRGDSDHEDNDENYEMETFG